MPRPLLRLVRDASQLQTVLNTLSTDLGRANDYLTLLDALRKQGQHFWRAFIPAPAFWHVVRAALQDAGLQGLARAYDDDTQALSLRTMLQVIAAEPPFLVRPDSFDAVQLEADLSFVNQRTNPAVKHLMIWRNNLLAHRNGGKILRGVEL